MDLAFNKKIKEKKRKRKWNLELHDFIVLFLSAVSNKEKISTFRCVLLVVDIMIRIVLCIHVVYIEPSPPLW